jgi:hypothetical protein
MKLTEAQQMMVDDGFPESLIIDLEARRKSWNEYIAKQKLAQQQRPTAIPPPTRRIPMRDDQPDDKITTIDNTPVEIKKPKKTKKVAKKKAKKAPPPKKTANRTPLEEDCGVQSGSKHSKILSFLAAKLGKQVPKKAIVKNLYGDPEVKTNRIDDLIRVMKKSKYEIKQEGDDGDITYGLYKK